MKRIKYFFQVWVGVVAGLVFLYLGVLLGNGLLDWVFTFTDKQILVGISVFVGAVTAATMSWLNSVNII